MQCKRLGNCAKIIFCSITPSRSKTQAAPTRWLVGANFLVDNVVAHNPTTNYAVPDEEWRLNKGDIVIKRIAPAFVNYIDFDPDDIYCGNNLIIVTPDDKADAKYLAMILNDRISELSKESSIGAVMKSISRNDLESLEIPMPDAHKRQIMGELWYDGVMLKKKRIKLAELENIRMNYLIKKNILTIGGKSHG